MGNKHGHNSSHKETAETTSWTNKISIKDLEKKQIYADFYGVNVRSKGNHCIWTHVKDIQDTKILVSLHHSRHKGAVLGIFDVSQRDAANKIYSFEEAVGGAGNGDVTYNAKRNLLGAISINGKIAYHLFNLQHNGHQNSNCVKLIRKSKWLPQYAVSEENYISDIDFDPSGVSAATIDRYGNCLISEVSTQGYNFHKKLGELRDNIGRARWSPSLGDPSLFVKYNEFNILDVEKQALILKHPIQLGNTPTYWIDVCQSNGNLVVSGDGEGSIRIYDRRQSKMVKTLEKIHADNIYCVRWNSSGTMFVSASGDTVVKVIDSKSWKVLHKENTEDGSKL